jgi:hypothetical protein
MARDIVRQTAVIAATCFMLVAAIVGTGLLGGTAVQDLQGGALDSDATFLAPARPAFAIWSAVYLLAIVYTVWQALPGQRTIGRQRALGWWIALTEVLNGLWLVAAQYGTLILTVIAIVVLLLALAWTFHRAVTVPGNGVTEALLIDGFVGLHLGWVSLATVANIAAWLTASGVRTDDPEAWGIGVLAVVGVVAVLLPVFGHGRWAPGLALAWGCSWLAVARLSGMPHSAGIGTAAIVVAVVALVAPGIVRLVRRSWTGEPVALERT